MESNELMVGNYVHVNGGLITVDDIISDYGINMHHDCWLHDLKDITPIPLTEDWLQKFGFVKKHNSGRSDDLMYWDSLKLSLFINYDGSINLGCELSEYEDCLPFNENEIKYVHQLQNLYHSLTGQKLTIKNTTL